MGLDMYLYSFEKSKREEGFRIKQEEASEAYYYDEIFLTKDEYLRLNKDYQKYFVKGIVCESFLNLDEICKYIFKTDTVEKWQIESIGSSYVNEHSKRFYMIKPAENSIFSFTNVKDLCLIDNADFSLTCTCSEGKNGKYGFTVDLIEKTSPPPFTKYKSCFISHKETEKYNALRYEIEYQRKGLTDDGWDLLPENCEYCFDSEVVEKLTKEGLDSEFLNSWVDGKTAFLAWW